MRTAIARLLTLLGLIAAMTIATAGVATTAASAGDVPAISPADDPLLHRQARSDKELRQQIALQLKLAPGGKQTAPNEISYNEGKFVVTYPLPSSAGMGSAAALPVPDCPDTWFCFYDGTDFQGARGKLKDCGWQDLSQYGWSDRVSSVDNETGSWVDYINHHDFGNPANSHWYDYILFGNGQYEGLRSLGSRNNMADHVDRNC